MEAKLESGKFTDNITDILRGNLSAQNFSHYIKEISNSPPKDLIVFDPSQGKHFFNFKFGLEKYEEVLINIKKSSLNFIDSVRALQVEDEDVDPDYSSDANRARPEDLLPHYSQSYQQTIWQNSTLYKKLSRRVARAYNNEHDGSLIKNPPETWVYPTEEQKMQFSEIARIRKTTRGLAQLHRIHSIFSKTPKDLCFEIVKLCTNGSLNDQKITDLAKQFFDKPQLTPSESNFNFKNVSNLFG